MTSFLTNGFLSLLLIGFFTAVWPISSLGHSHHCGTYYRSQAITTKTNELAQRLDKEKTKTAWFKAKYGLPNIVAVREGSKTHRDLVLVDPNIIPMTNDKRLHLENCSVMGKCFLVPRFKHIKIKYKDENGKPQILEAHHDLSFKLQNLMDQVNGVAPSEHSLFRRFHDQVNRRQSRQTYPTHIQKFAKLVDETLEGSYNPYSLAYDVRKTFKESNEFETSIHLLLAAMLNNTSAIARASHLNDWITSEAHALLVYDLMNSAGLKNFHDELNYLLSNSMYFIESLKSGASLVTYSFEKEGATDDISLLFRPTEFSEKNWMAKDHAERIALLKNAKIPSKTFIHANKIMPTDFKPEAIGGYSKEVSDHRKHDYGWEISHKRYEINQQRVMRQIREVALLFNQNHSLHVHVSFELPKNYAFYENFINWYKHVNDYLYLKGLEEGLHGNYLTGVANFVGDLSLNDRIRHFFEGLYTPNTIQESQSKLSRRNSKFFSAGLRAKIYGKASSDDNVRVGIELRDTTRNLNLLDEYISHVGQGVSTRVWEKSDPKTIRRIGLRLTSNRKAAEKSLEGIVSPRFATLFAKTDSAVSFGLHPYETQPVYDYITQAWVKVSEITARRIQEARKLYIKDLKDLEAELTALEAKGEHTESEIIQTAIRMSLSSWAKSAKAAELFQGF